MLDIDLEQHDFHIQRDYAWHIYNQHLENTWLAERPARRAENARLIAEDAHRLRASDLTFDFRYAINLAQDDIRSLIDFESDYQNGGSWLWCVHEMRRRVPTNGKLEIARWAFNTLREDADDFGLLGSIAELWDAADRDFDYVQDMLLIDVMQAARGEGWKSSPALSVQLDLIEKEDARMRRDAEAAWRTESNRFHEQQWQETGEPDAVKAHLAEWQLKRANDRAAADVEWRKLFNRNCEIDQFERDLAAWNAKYDYLWPKQKVHSMQTAMAVAPVPMLAGQTAVADLGRDIVDAYLEAASSGRRKAADAPRLPEAMAYHPLFAALNDAIALVVGEAAATPAAFRSTEVLGVLSVLAAAHPPTYEAVKERIQATGAALPDSRVNAAVQSFEGRVQRETRTGAGWATDNKGLPDSSNSDNVSVFLRILGVEVRFNAWSNRIEICCSPTSKWQPFSEQDFNLLLTTANNGIHNFRPRENVFKRALAALAHEKSFDPVLVRIADAQAAWDGTARLASWLSTTCGVSADAYHSAVGRNVIGGIVRRARLPGSKHDEVMVLSGPQGNGKSTLCRILALDDAWFTDSVTFDGSPQNVVPMLFGKTVIELGELSGMQRREVQHIKRFLSEQRDNVTLKYEAFSSDHPRRCIFIGTTNEENPLVDATGNRRFLPVRVERAIDTDWLAENIDQLIGEAAEYEAAGDTFGIPRDVWGVASAHQESARSESPMEVLLMFWFGNVANDTFITSADLLHALTESKQGASVKSAGPIMKRLGFRPYQGRDPSLGKVRTWLKSERVSLSGCVQIVPMQSGGGRVEMRLRSVAPPSSNVSAG